MLSGLLLGGATSNPLIGSFAVIAGLLIYYNFVSQAMLIAASWMAVSLDDAGVVVDQKVFDAASSRPARETRLGARAGARTRSAASGPRLFRRRVDRDGGSTPTGRRRWPRVA